MHLKNCRILTRLALGFGLTLALTLCLGTYAWRSMHVVDQNTTAVEMAYMPLVLKANRLTSHVSQGIALLKDYFAASVPNALAEGMQHLTVAMTYGVAIEEMVFTTPPLSSLEMASINLNTAFHIYMHDVETLGQTYTALGEAHNVLEAAALACSDIAVHLLAIHQDLTIVDNSLPRKSSEHMTSRALNQIVASMNTKVWELRLVMLRARLSSEIEAGKDILCECEALGNGLEHLQTVSGHAECKLSLTTLHKSVSVMTDATKAYLKAWGKAQHQHHTTRISGATLLAAAQYVSTRGVELTMREANAASAVTSKSAQQLILYTFFVAVLNMGAAIALGAGITKPLDTCVKYAESVAAGHLDQPLHLDR